MKQKQLFFILLFFSAFVVNANNRLPVKFEKILPILNTIEADLVLPILNSEVVPSKKQVKKTFQFPNVDAAINKQLIQQKQNLILDENTVVDGNDNLANILVKANEYKLNEKVAKARAALGKAIEIGKFIQQLEAGELVTFPLVMSNTFGNITYTLAIESIKLKSQYAELEVYMGIDIPDKDIVLYFGSPNVKFSSEGGIIGDAVLGLYAEVPLSLGGEKSALLIKPYAQNAPINGDNSNIHTGTYVRIDCDGFKEMGLEAEVHFSRDWIVPTDASGEMLATGRVVGTFQTIVSDFNNILQTVDLPNFALAKKPDIQFELSNAVFDFSDFRNDPSVVFPQAYTEQNLLPGNANLWRGVYIESVKVTLPKVFKKKDCVAENDEEQNAPPKGSSGSIDLPTKQEDYEWAFNDQDSNNHGPSASDIVPKKISNTNYTTAAESCRLSFGAEHLLIDPQGVSGEFYATNVININEGSMEKWSYSIDSINVDVVMNEITGFGFSGEIGIPIAKQSQNFTYGAFIDDSDNYFFSLGIADEMEFPIFKAAEVSLKPGSKIEVEVKSNKFYPRAILTGSLSIGLKENENDSKELVDAPGIEFHKLLIHTKPSYIGILDSGYFRVNGDIGFANFPVSINDISLVNLPGAKAGLNFEIHIHMMNAQDHGFSAEGEFTVIGKLKTEGGVQSWKYDKLQFEGAEISIVLPTVKGSGFIKLFRGDETFGHGFQAGITLEIMDGKFGVESNAIFGKTLTGGSGNQGYRYWYVDGMVTFSPGIPIVGPLVINGFGGGLYHHMKMTAYDPNYDGPGATTSGMVYTPNEGTNFGLKASVSFITTNPSQAASGKENGTLKGVATLQLEFGGGGLQNLSLLATAQFLEGGDGQQDSGSAIMAKLNKRKEKLGLNTAQTKSADKNEMKNPATDIRASVHIVLDFEHKFELNAMLAVYAKLAKGKLYGIGSNKLVGAAHILAKQGKWHIYIGGYKDNSIVVEGFNGDNVVMSPVGIMLKDGPLTITAKAYFMIGNDIPGPPKVPGYILSRFKIKAHDVYDTSAVPGRMARGTGFAFGAEVGLEFKYKKDKRKYVNVDGVIGFDIAMLKYKSGAYCAQSNQSPIGAKGWRASGNIYGDVRAKARWGRACPKINAGIGIILIGDVPNPSKFYCKVKFWKIRKGFNIGDACTVMAGGGDF